MKYWRWHIKEWTILRNLRKYWGTPGFWLPRFWLPRKAREAKEDWGNTKGSLGSTKVTLGDSRECWGKPREYEGEPRKTQGNAEESLEITWPDKNQITSKADSCWHQFFRNKRSLMPLCSCMWGISTQRGTPVWWPRPLPTSTRWILGSHEGLYRGQICQEIDLQRSNVFSERFDPFHIYDRKSAFAWLPSFIDGSPR